ncbi:molybdopterin molybdenumtransferase MoeA [Ectothiorhodospiraceae bacterium BW-2]|nr:molybdopterin molybdenumtransferase MoeA [Ectothiorhodospiraceae bacterium BW-2]
MTACGCDTQATKGLLTVDEALAQMLSQAVPLTESEALPLTSALGRVLAETITSPIDVPPHDNSAMDGYALHHEDSHAGENRLAISQRICAGEIGTPLQRGTVARIFTGAPIPPGADSVIMQEQITMAANEVVFQGAISAGENVRAKGEDITQGSKVLSQGRRLRPQELGLAASVGRATLSLYRRLKVGIFFTGDELIEPGTPLPEGKIYDSNRFVLTTLLQQMGCEVINLGIVEDSLAATMAALKSLTASIDLIMTTGGVSVGEEDHVRHAIEQLGQLSMWRVAMKPGKPLAFGHLDHTPFIGLPGNPVSVFVTFTLFAAPFIKKRQGMSRYHPQPLPMQAAFSWPKVKRQEYLRVRLEMVEGQRQLTRFPHQGSGVLTSISWADGLAKIPTGHAITPGECIDYYPFEQLL